MIQAMSTATTALNATEELGQRIRARRHALDLSQEAFAAEVGLHRTYIGAVERGERNVTVLTLLRIAAALGVDAAELVEGLSHE